MTREDLHFRKHSQAGSTRWITSKMMISVNTFGSLLCARHNAGQDKSRGTSQKPLDLFSWDQSKVLEKLSNSMVKILSSRIPIPDL